MTISTHVLDTSIGRPAEAVDVRLLAQQRDNSWLELGRSTTGSDGRVAVPLIDVRAEAGVYSLRFDVGTYFRRRGVNAFYAIVNVEFNVTDPASHYHVPLLVSPYGYSTYRGS